MEYKLLGFSQTGTVRKFWFQRVGELGDTPVRFSVLADVDLARRYRVPIQDLPSLCSRLLYAFTSGEPAGPLTLGEADMSSFSTQAMKAALEAVRKRPRPPQPQADAPAVAVESQVITGPTHG